KELQPQTRYAWQVHHSYGGEPSRVAVEVRPRFGTMTGWRVLIPASSDVVAVSWGAAGGGAMSMTTTSWITGTITLDDGTKCKFMGSADVLSPSVSAYAVFDRQLPEFVGFGQAGPTGVPSGYIERIQFR
ncbi:MAG: hypothetical protein IH822_03295, partial [Chloroflexi bacterium]|nr:hypothetical protein [Chloroflexota bacterium]